MFVPRLKGTTVNKRRTHSLLFFCFWLSLESSKHTERPIVLTTNACFEHVFKMKLQAVNGYVYRQRPRNSKQTNHDTESLISTVCLGL